MNTKKWLLGSLGVFVVYQILYYLIHSVILVGAYEATLSVWRPAEEMKNWIPFLSTAIFALLFVFIFTKGYEGKGIMEGVRYGFWMGLLISIPQAYTFYAVLDIPYSLAWQWWVYQTIQIVICGVVVAAIYKPEAAPAQKPAETPEQKPAEG
ncbi:hypothetical protein ACFL6I_03695 [candidate division KSB1 bacterium]